MQGITEYSLRYTLKEGLSRFVLQEYKRDFPKDYRKTMTDTLTEISINSRIKTLENLTDEGIYQKIDLNGWLQLVLQRWNDVFSKRFNNGSASNVQTLCRALVSFRHSASHEQIAVQDYENDLLQFAENGAKLLVEIGEAAQAQKLRELVDKITARPIIIEPPIDEDDTQVTAAVKTSRGLCLQVVQPDGTTKHIPLDLESFSEHRLVIGRKRQNGQGSISIDDPRVSRLHLLITRSADNKLTLTDLLSANGTRIEDEKLHHNQTVEWPLDKRIIVGSMWLILRRGS